MGIELWLQECPTPLDKVSVLKEMIFPQCEKLGQTIIFVRTREVARSLHAAVSLAYLLPFSCVQLNISAFSTALQQLPCISSHTRNTGFFQICCLVSWMHVSGCSYLEDDWEKLCFILALM